MNNMYLFYRSVRYEFRCWAAEHPLLYNALLKVKTNDYLGARLADPSTDIVIDAFPRSGNTFAYFAFQMSQERDLNVGHHSHAPSQFILADRYHVPSVLIVRAPADAVCSFVQREKVVSLRQTLRMWIKFHEALLPYKENIVVTTFDSATTDFGAVIARVNENWGTDFSPFEHSEKNVKACFEAIERRNAERYGGGRLVESSVARPSIARKNEKFELMRGFEDRRTNELLRSACAIYDNLVGTEF